MINRLKRKFFNWFYIKYPPEMVKYWMTKQAVKAKVTQAREGHYIMWMDGEKYPFPGFPRGWLLFGSLSKVKHIIKNFIFNDSWDLLSKGYSAQEVADRIKSDGMDKVIELAREARYDMLPPSRMCPAVREIYRALSVVGKNSSRILALRDCLCFVLQEDDGYRFRVQWLTHYFPKRRWLRKIYLKSFDVALTMMEHAEIIGDMKERIRLLRRVLMALLQDKRVYQLFEEFCDEVNWKKVKLTRADKYYFRAKYFKCDFDKFDY
jgi:hypothetical protein